MGLRLRVYGGDRLRRDRLIGEKFIAFSTLDLDDLDEQGQGQGQRQSLERTIELEPRSNIEVRVDACVSGVLRRRFMCNRFVQQEAFEKCWAHSPLRAAMAQ